MSCISDFARKAMSAGPQTLDDHLTLQGCLDHRKRKVFRQRIARELETAGKLRQLVDDGICLASGTARGASATWEHGLPVYPNTLPMILVADDMRDLRNSLATNATYLTGDARIKVLKLTEANLSGRTGASVARAAESLLHVSEIFSVRLEASEREKEIIREQNAFLRKLVLKQNAGVGVAPGNVEGTDK